MKRPAPAHQGSAPARPRPWLVYLLGVPTGAFLGAVAFYLAAVAAFGLGVISSFGIGPYWWQSASIGAVFGALQAPFVCSLRGRGRWAFLAPGLAMFLVWLFFSLARSGLDLSQPLRFLKHSVGMGLLMGGAGALTACWTLGALTAAERGVVLSRGFRGGALAALGIGLVAVGVLSSMRRHREAVAPEQVCRRFAQAFAAGNAESAISMFYYATGASATPAEARYWLAKAKPFLPVGGRAEIIGWRYFGPKTSWCMCKARVVGATYRVQPSTGAQEATFDVRVHRYGDDWKVSPPELALETYLASLYGEDAGRRWQRFLLTAPVP